MKTFANTISEYNNLQSEKLKVVCDFLQENIGTVLKKSESKIWHGSPVWFIDGNPIVAYSLRKRKKDDERISLMFFSGQSFKESDLKPEGKFKAAEVFYNDVKDIKVTKLKTWLKKSKEIQWDYKNIVKRKGVLIRL